MWWSFTITIITIGIIITWWSSIIDVSTGQTAFRAGGVSRRGISS
jgi:hypothetical protein